MNGKKQILVCQHGARHRYAIPRMLEKQGMLSAFYTDAHSGSRLGKVAVAMKGWAPGAVRRLTGRVIAGVPREKIFSSDTYRLLEFGQNITGRGKDEAELLDQRYRLLSRSMKRWGVQDSQAVYSMYNENPDFIRWAKAQGLQSIVDVYINPVSHRIMAPEYEKFPEWGDRPDDKVVQSDEAGWRLADGLADILLCPSEWVADGVRSISPQSAEKIRVVPYGCSIEYHGQINRPVEGRIFFAGGDVLRKGLRYLAQAATLLKASLPKLEVRVAGLVPDEVAGHPVCRDLRFLGKLNTEQMKNEFLCSDVFVLPSLSEGFAGVVAEAIGGGCPVIVTKEAGSPVVHEREGLIIPARDEQALADAMERMICDRTFRQRCSDECRARTPYYSEPAWAERLVDALKS